MNAVAWFREIWPRRKKLVMQDYMALREFEHFLADVAVRGGVLAKIPNQASDRQAAVLEGRRQLAIEILELARMPPERLRQIIEVSELNPKKQTDRSP